MEEAEPLRLLRCTIRKVRTERGHRDNVSFVHGAQITLSSFLFAALSAMEGWSLRAVASMAQTFGKPHRIRTNAQ